MSWLARPRPWLRQARAAGTAQAQTQAADDSIPAPGAPGRRTWQPRLARRTKPQQQVHQQSLPSGPGSPARPLQQSSSQKPSSVLGTAGQQQGSRQEQLRRQLCEPGQQRLRFSKPIVVEGHNDRLSVQRAVEAQVYVLGGSTHAFTEPVLAELRQLKERHGGLVVLTDCDVAGRQARNQLESQLPGCLHAFVPAPRATSATSNDWHEAGNVGVEHASPPAIQEALGRARPGDAKRSEFTRDDLIQLGLVAPHHTNKGGDFAARRALVCSYLGVGNSDGKQLLRQLNMYGFLREDLAAALLWAKQQQQQQPQQQQQRRQQLPSLGQATEGA